MVLRMSYYVEMGFLEKLRKSSALFTKLRRCYQGWNKHVWMTHGTHNGFVISVHCTVVVKHYNNKAIYNKQSLQ